MSWISILPIIAIALALGFDFVNGFHDTANAVATVIYTKALRPQVAIVMSGTLNFLGALVVGTAVAMEITRIIPQTKITLVIIIAVLIGAVIWNLITWYLGLPVSSAHCLIGSLFGAGILANGQSGVSWPELNKVLAALLISPLAGFICAAGLTWVVARLIPTSAEGKKQPKLIRWMQVVSSASVSFSHGTNDGQKTMGVITLILASQFANYGYTYQHVPLWVMITAGLAIGLGTATGGWRVIRTVGTKITREKLTYGQGFAAEFSTATIIYVASLLGVPISTTHTLTSAVAGCTIPVYGAGKLNRKTLQMILLAWLLTLPVSATLSAGSYAVLSYVLPIKGTGFAASQQ